MGQERGVGGLHALMETAGMRVERVGRLGRDPLQALVYRLRVVRQGFDGGLGGGGETPMHLLVMGEKGGVGGLHAIVEAVGMGVERARSLARDLLHALVEMLRACREGRHRVLGGRGKETVHLFVMGAERRVGGGEPLAERITVGRQRARGLVRGRGETLVEMVGVARQKSQRRRRGLGQARLQDVAMLVERARGVRRGGGQALVQTVGMRRERVGDLVGGLLEAAVQRGAVLLEAGVDLAVALLEQAGEVVVRMVEQGARGLRALADHAGDALAHVAETAVELVAVGGDDVVQPVAGLGEAHREVVAARHDLVGNAGAGLVEPGDDRIGPLTEVGNEDLAGGGELALDRTGTLVDRGGDAVGGRLEAGHQILAAGTDVGGQAVAGADQRGANLVALAAESGGDSLAGLGEGHRQRALDALEVARERLVGAGDGAAHLLGVSDNGLALGRQLVDQRAHAALVVAKGALDVRNLGAHQRFQLAGAGQRPLDAVAHGGDLATDSLTEGHHLLGGDGLRLGETHGDLEHGARGEPHLLGAAHQRRRHEEEQQRSDDGEQDQRHLRLQKARAGEFAAIGVKIDRAYEDPQHGGEAGDDHGRARRPGLERAQDGADALLVVVGGRGRGSRRRAIGRHAALGRHVEHGLDGGNRLRCRRHGRIDARKQLGIVLGRRQAGTVVATPRGAGDEQRMQAIVGGDLEATLLAQGLGGVRLVAGSLHVGSLGRQGRHRRLVIAAEVEGFLDRRQGRSRRILSLGGVGHCTPRYTGRVRPAAVHRPKHHLLTKRTLQKAVLERNQAWQGIAKRR